MGLTYAAVTNNDLTPINGGSIKVVPVKITFDSSYATGGESIVASDFGLYRIITVICSTGSVGGRIAVWDPVNAKLKLYTAVGTEASNTSDQSSIVVYATIIGQ